MNTMLDAFETRTVILNGIANARYNPCEWPRLLNKGFKRDKTLCAVSCNRSDDINRCRDEAYSLFARVSSAGRNLNPKHLFDSLARGDINWRQLKIVYADNPKRLQPIMQKVNALRNKHFNRLTQRAQGWARQGLLRDYNTKLMGLRHRFADNEPIRLQKCRELTLWYQDELKRIEAEPLRTGSDDPTSDIDRSWLSPRTCEAAKRLMEIHMGIPEPPDRQCATSTRCFDVNEYYNVMPWVKDTVPHRKEFAKEWGTTVDGGYLAHNDIVEANSLSAAMMHMTAAQKTQFEANKLAEMRCDSQALVKLKRQFVLAEHSLALGKQTLQVKIVELAAKYNLAPRDPETEHRARDILYGERMIRLVKLEQQMARTPGHSAEWRALCAQYERDMNFALREGIGTYSDATGLDIIINTLQLKKNVRGEKMTLHELMKEKDFTIRGELREKYTAQQVNGMINDQVMMMMWHVNAYHQGLETSYAAAQALSKYAERTLLALKIQGKDILSLTQSDPLRQLYEVSSNLAKHKSDPDRLSEELSELAGDGATADDGMRRFLEMLQALPGMQDMTAVRLSVRSHLQRPIACMEEKNNGNAVAPYQELEFIVPLATLDRFNGFVIESWANIGTATCDHCQQNTIGGKTSYTLYNTESNELYVTCSRFCAYELSETL